MWGEYDDPDVDVGERLRDRADFERKAEKEQKLLDAAGPAEDVDDREFEGWYDEWEGDLP